MTIHFFVPDIHSFPDPSTYAHKTINGLKRKGFTVKTYLLPGDFPFPSDESIRKYIQLVQSVPESEPVVFDAEAIASTPYVLKDISQHNPVICIVHVPLCIDPQYSAYQRTMITSLEKESYSYVSLFAATSEFAVQQLRNIGVEEEKIRLIIPGTSDAKQKVNYPVVPFRMLSVANLSRNRDHSILVRAFSSLKTKKWTLDCYGNFSSDMSYKANLQEMISRYGLDEKIKLHEVVSENELEEVYAHADLFVHPADFDAYGISLMEALAHGVPVVASTGGGILNTVPADMGYFYKPGDVYGLGNIMEELFDNPGIYKKICTRASVYHTTAQSWEQSIQKFEEIVKGLRLEV